MKPFRIRPKTIENIFLLFSSKPKVVVWKLIVGWWREAWETINYCIYICKRVVNVDWTKLIFFFCFLFLFGSKIYLNLRRQESVLFKLKENLIKLSRENKAIFINIYTRKLYTLQRTYMGQRYNRLFYIYWVEIFL